LIVESRSAAAVNLAHVQYPRGYYLGFYLSCMSSLHCRVALLYIKITLLMYVPAPPRLMFCCQAYHYSLLACLTFGRNEQHTVSGECCVASIMSSNAASDSAAYVGVKFCMYPLALKLPGT
jgi:hypothetical protein